MTLSEKQQIFAFNVAKLIFWAYQQGYKITFAEAYRDPRLAQLNAQAETGIVNTLHSRRLAIDLNLFKDGLYLSSTEAYRPLGDYWKSLDPLNCWGGDFTAIVNGVRKPKPDSDHFSMTDGGIK